MQGHVRGCGVARRARGMAGATVPTEIQRFADMVLRKQARRPWAKGPGQGGCGGEQKGLGDPQISHILFL